MTEDTHRVVHKRYAHGDEVYEPGDTLTPPESALENHPDRFEPITESEEFEPVEEPDSEDDTPGETSEGPDSTQPEDLDIDEVREGSIPFDEFIPSLTVSEIRDVASEWEDPSIVRAAIRAEEESDDPRTTALDALESRLNAVEGE